ncbi:MAG: ATP-binding protein [Pseudomonadota bacterium]
MSIVADLTRTCPVLTPDVSVADAAQLFLQPECEQFLSLPVVTDRQPVGMLTRHALQHIYMSRFGRDLHGRKSVADVMQATPLVVAADMPVEQASRHITAHIAFPIREDFVVVDDLGFAGVGVVVDLLKAMEERVARRNGELAAAYRKLKESQAQLVQSEKMASLGQMVAGVAHEINTPLGYVRSNIEIIRGLMVTLHAELDAHSASQALAGETRALLDDSTQLLDDTLYGCDQIGELVTGLKDFSRLDRNAVADTDLNECIDGALLIARNITRNRVEVVRRYGSLPAVACVPSQINQVMLNLIANAAHAIKGSGRILIRTWADESGVHASIQDNGHGIPRENLARIFDPFFTTKPAGQGTGLGLAICYRIVQEHGGRIRVGSEVGRGTRFIVTLPAGAGLPAEKAAPVAPADRPEPQPA